MDENRFDFSERLRYACGEPKTKENRGRNQMQAGDAQAVISSGVPRFSAIALDVVRHALPLVPFYLLHGSSTSYLLLTAFDLSLGLMLIVGTTRDAKDPTTVDPRAAWLISRVTATLVLSIFLGLVAAILSIPLGLPAFIFGWATGVDWHALVLRPGFWISAVRHDAGDRNACAAKFRIRHHGG